jgi:hypothetical protein
VTKEETVTAMKQWREKGLKLGALAALWVLSAPAAFATTGGTSMPWDELQDGAMQDGAGACRTVLQDGAMHQSRRSGPVPTGRCHAPVQTTDDREAAERVAAVA